MKKMIIFLIYSLITLKAFSTEIKVVAMGDIAECSEAGEIGVKTTSGLLNQESFDLFFPLGDLVYPKATKSLLNNCYSKYFGKYKNKTFPTVGNHEYYANEGKPYFEYFHDNLSNFKNLTNIKIHQKEKDNWPNYWRFDKDNWTFISLDTNTEDGYDLEQIKWLEEQIKTKKQCSILMMHHPYRSLGYRAIKEEVNKIMEKLKDNPVSIILTGHDHHYQESNVINKTKHYLVGTGGITINSFVNPIGINVKHSNFNHGYLKLVLGDNSYNSQFVTKEGALYNTTERCN